MFKITSTVTGFVGTETGEVILEREVEIEVIEEVVEEPAEVIEDDYYDETLDDDLYYEEEDIYADEPEVVSLDEASEAMASASSADEVLSVVESTMASGADVIADEGTIVSEIATITINPTGEPPKFDASSWLQDSGISVEAGSGVNSQVLAKKIGERYSLPSKKSIMSDGKVQMGYSNKRKDLSFNEIADRYVASLQSTGSGRMLAEVKLDRVDDDRPGR